MEIQDLKKILQENGIVGAGGAGFPTYAKLDQRAESIILNCAECEPLLKLHRQLLQKYAKEILETFHMVAETVGAKEAIIGIKAEYKTAAEAVQTYMHQYPNMRVQLLDSAYPMGDEVVLIYEATGKVIRPGGLPIEEGVAVFNVETMYNIYQAVTENKPVSDKLVTIAGEVEQPVTVRVPIGMSIGKTVELAGEILVKNPVYWLGGPMMGWIGSSEDTVTKTTNAVIVLEESHLLVQKKKRRSSIDLKRAASSCCQCETCTDLCPRNALGHPIEPHKFMRSAANQDFAQLQVFLDTMYCCSCGICELYACPQDLAPRSLLADYKAGLRAAGVKPLNIAPEPVKESRSYRKVPEKRLEARLGLSRYDAEALLREDQVVPQQVKINMSQHIGAPAAPIVKKGETVKAGQMIGAPNTGLSVGVHASVAGKVIEVNPQYIVIVREG